MLSGGMISKLHKSDRFLEILCFGRLFNLAIATLAFTLMGDEVRAAEDAPDGYKLLCKRNEACDAGGTAYIGYGAAGIYSYRMLCGKFTCIPELFKEGNPELADAGCYIATNANSPDECAPGSVIRNKVVDCGGKKIGLGCRKDDEYQPPVLTLSNATVKNLVISADGAADGIHCVSGDCNLINVVWEDICEDAATHLSDGGTLTVTGGSAFNSEGGPGNSKPDKIFQHNSKNSTIIINDFTLKGQHGKLWRSCGNCYKNGGPRNVTINNLVIEGKVTSGLVGVNANYGDTATIKNVTINNYKEGEPKICIEWEGVSNNTKDRTKGPESKKIGEMWETKNCIVTKSDVTSDGAASPKN